MRKAGLPDVRIWSAETEPGVDISRQASKALDAVPIDGIDRVVTLRAGAAA